VGACWFHSTGALGDEKDLILMCYQSRDLREGMDAFLCKRPPQWTGE
jgi:enoyl-CoA hydratase